MQHSARPQRVAVFGLPDLATTALVAALRAAGVPAGVLPPRPAPPRATGGVAVVDLDRVSGPPDLAAELHAAGWTVIVLAVDSTSQLAAAAATAGAEAWLSTQHPIGVLVACVRRMAAGEPAMAPDDRVAWKLAAEEALTEAADRAAPLQQLSRREREVLDGLARGDRAADLAQASMVSITTVRSQISAILRKLGVNSQAHAVEIYREAFPAAAAPPVWPAGSGGADEEAVRVVTPAVPPPTWTAARPRDRLGSPP